MTQLVNEHMGELYRITSAETYHKAFLKLETATQQICSFIPTGPPRSEVPTLNVIGLDSLGQHYSTFVDDFVKQMQLNATDNPVSNATVVTPNNTTEYGTPMTPGPELRKVIQSSRETTTLKFLATDTLPDGSSTHGIRCQLHFTEDSLTRSPDREGSCKFLLVCSNKAEEGHPVNIFCKSKLWRRDGAVLEMVEAHPRDQMRNFSAPIINDDEQHSGHHSVDRRQWNSGVSLWKAILTSVFRGLGLGPDRLAVIRHASAFDDQLARTCILMNQEKKAGLPMLGYAAVAAAPKPVIVQENIKQATKSYLHTVVQSGTYQVGKVKLPSHFEELGKASSATTEAPKWKETDYTICHPRGLELPILQTEIERWCNCGVPAIAEELKRLVEKHDKDHNPSGKPWSRSRGHEQVDKDPEEPSPEPATKVSRKEGEPETLEQLKEAAGACEIITSTDGSYDQAVTSSGHLYINPRFDGTLSPQSLCLIPGQFKQGNAAEAIKQDATNWLEFKITSDSTTVLGRTSVPLSKPIPDKPMQLTTFLSKLEAAGHVRFTIKGHKVEKVPSANQSRKTHWKFESSETTILQLGQRGKKSDGTDAKLTLDTMGVALSVPSLKSTQPLVAVYPRLNYNLEANEIRPGYFSLYLKKPVQVEKGKLINMLGEVAS